MKMILKILPTLRYAKKEMTSDFLDDDATSLSHTNRMVVFPDRTIIYYHIGELTEQKLQGYLFDRVIIDDNIGSDLSVKMRNYIKTRIR